MKSAWLSIINTKTKRVLFVITHALLIPALFVWLWVTGTNPNILEVVIMLIWGFVIVELTSVALFIVFCYEICKDKDKWKYL